jgi:hypothetical protein
MGSNNRRFLDEPCSAMSVSSKHQAVLTTEDVANFIGDAIKILTSPAIF